MGYGYSSVGQFVNFINTKADTIIDKERNEYSNNTLIISVAADAPEEKIVNFLKSKCLEIVEKMDNLKMYTVKLEKPMTASELDNYIIELEKSEYILAANKNYILHLD